MQYTKTLIIISIQYVNFNVHYFKILYRYRYCLLSFKVKIFFNTYNFTRFNCHNINKIMINELQTCKGRSINVTHV